MYLTTSPVYNAMVEHMTYQSSLHYKQSIANYVVSLPIKTIGFVLF
jgi:hypothetical protein